MKPTLFTLFWMVGALACGCARKEAPPRIEPFEVRVAQEVNGHYTVASLNLAKLESDALAAELAKAGIVSPMETGIVCEVWADIGSHPKVIRFLSGHPKFRDKVVCYYAIPKEEN